MPNQEFPSFAAIAMRNVCQWRNFGLTEKDWIYGQDLPRLSLQAKIQKTVRIALAEMAFLGVALLASSEMIFTTAIVTFQAVARFVIPIRQEERAIWISGMKESLFTTAWALYDALFGNFYFDSLVTELAFAHGVSGIRYENTRHHQSVIRYWNRYMTPAIRGEGRWRDMALHFRIPELPAPGHDGALGAGPLLNPIAPQLPGVAEMPVADPPVLMGGAIRERDIEEGTRLLMEVVFNQMLGDRTVEDEATVDLVLEADARIYRFLTARAAFEYVCGLKREVEPSVFRAFNERTGRQSKMMIAALRMRAVSDEEVEAVRQKLVSVEAFEPEIGADFIARDFYRALLEIASTEAFVGGGILIRECLHRATQLKMQERAAIAFVAREDRIVRWDARALVGGVDARIRGLHERIDGILHRYGLEAIDRAYVISMIALAIFPLFFVVPREPFHIEFSVNVFNYPVRGERIIIEGVCIAAIAVLARLVFMTYAQVVRDRVVFD